MSLEAAMPLKCQTPTWTLLIYTPQIKPHNAHLSFNRSLKSPRTHRRRSPCLPLRGLVSLARKQSFALSSPPLVPFPSPLFSPTYETPISTLRSHKEVLT